jgi:hypothetical protein
VESPGKVGVKALGWKLAKVSLGHEIGFKIIPKMMPKCYKKKYRLVKSLANP